MFIFCSKSYYNLQELILITMYFFDRFYNVHCENDKKVLQAYIFYMIERSERSFYERAKGENYFFWMYMVAVSDNSVGPARPSSFCEPYISTTMSHHFETKTKKCTPRQHEIYPNSENVEQFFNKQLYERYIFKTMQAINLKQKTKISDFRSGPSTQRASLLFKLT